jgi:hypothetical protein
MCRGVVVPPPAVRSSAEVLLCNCNVVQGVNGELQSEHRLLHRRVEVPGVVLPLLLRDRPQVLPRQQLGRDRSVIRLYKELRALRASCRAHRRSHMQHGLGACFFLVHPVHTKGLFVTSNGMQVLVPLFCLHRAIVPKTTTATYCLYQ